MKQIPPQQGFVLALTLWILAAMAIVVGVFAERVNTMLNLAKASRENIESRIDIESTRADIIFRLITTPMGYFGLGPTPEYAIALDGRPYQGAGKTLVRLQDDRGLINLGIPDEERIHRFLGVIDVPFEQRGKLIDILLDYTDEDDLRRLNGAEAREYNDNNLPPPRNSKLLSPFEISNILLWRDLPQARNNGRLIEWVTATDTVGINPNTAPWEILATFPGIDLERARQITESRASKPFRSADEFTRLMGIAGGEMIGKIIAFPASTLRVTHSIPGQAWALRYSISLTPFAKDQPWQINYQYRLPNSEPNEPPKSQFKLPDINQIPQATGQPVLPF